uniref:Diphthamide biosynthesis protein 3 n=1 Tax=Strongyloides stercoralis TaxID=6248 RepID=A0A0K0E8N8_STRER
MSIYSIDRKIIQMSVFHDEVEIEDFDFDDEKDVYWYPCPCGDRFEITKEMLELGEDVATCPSCSLIIRVIYDPEMFSNMETISMTVKASA